MPTLTEPARTAPATTLDKRLADELQPPCDWGRLLSIGPYEAACALPAEVIVRWDIRCDHASAITLSCHSHTQIVVRHPGGWHCTACRADVRVISTEGLS